MIVHLYIYDFQFKILNLRINMYTTKCVYSRTTDKVINNEKESINDAGRHLDLRPDSGHAERLLE